MNKEIFPVVFGSLSTHISTFTYAYENIKTIDYTDKKDTKDEAETIVDADF
jgi:hypothetical protein